MNTQILKHSTKCNNDKNNNDMIDYKEDRPYVIAIIRETKHPRDTRVPLTPRQCAQIVAKHGDKIKIVVERCSFRCYSDKEYAAAGIELVDSAKEADLLLGVKEVCVDSLMEHRTYIMFSHTIKKQSHNRGLLQAVLNRQVRLLDWECMKNDQGLRVIAFGRWAGIVGAHNSVMTWGIRTAKFKLTRLHEVSDWQAAKDNYANEVDADKLRGLRIALTGDGRVSSGCCEVLDALGLRKVSTDEFLHKNWQVSDPGCYVQLPADCLYRKDADESWTPEFFVDPNGYHSVVWPFLTKANVLINGIFWDSRCPPLFTADQMARPEFSVQVIGDITCDIAPVASIPSTLRASTIRDPVFGFDPSTSSECAPYGKSAIDVMAVDNLPNELPRDASSSFGDMFMHNVLDEIVKPAGASKLVNDATIADAGQLTPAYHYLHDFVSESAL